MEIADIVSRWKELGALGVGVLVLAKLGDKAFVWVLDILGVRIKRSQSREDELDKVVATMRCELDAVKEDVVQMRGALRTYYGIVHRAADGIQRELQRASVELPTVQFFIEELRTVQPVEEILKD